jgi:hypothetical protein
MNHGDFLLQVDRWLILLLCDAAQNPALEIKDIEYYSILLCLVELCRHEAISVGDFDRLN